MLQGPHMPPTTTQVDRALDPEPLVRYAHATLPTIHGVFNVIVYRRGESAEEMLAITKGPFPATEPLFVRVHSECYTGEVLGSLKCDCADQLAQALDTI